MKDKLKNIDNKTFLLYITILLFIIMYGIGIIMFGSKGFQKPQVFLNLFISNAGLIVIATGMTMVIISGGIDISVGSFVALTCMVLAYLMEKVKMNALSAIVLVIIIGLIFGLVQGILISYLNIQPFIVTLAGMFFARGMTAIISQEMISITNETFLSWANKKITIPLFGIVNKKGAVVYPYIYPTVIVALIILVLMFILLKYAKFSGNIIIMVDKNNNSCHTCIFYNTAKYTCNVEEREEVAINGHL